MASIKAAGNQIRLFTRALSAEEKKKIQLAAQQDAARRAAVGVTEGSGNYLPAKALQERDRPAASGLRGAAQALGTVNTMTAGVRAQKLPNLTGRTGVKAAVPGTAYRQAAGPAAAQPQEKQSYFSFARPAAGFKSGMSAEDQAAWNAIGARYAAGDAGWNRDTNRFREEGNWGSYTDADGRLNGWLMAADGTGGYAPVFGGKVGETGYQAGTVFYAPDGSAYTMDADGTLRESGTVEWLKYGQYIGPQAGYHYGGGSFLGQDENGNYTRYDYDTVPDDVLERYGYYRDGDAVMPINNDYYMAKALRDGVITQEQLRAAQAQAAKAKEAAAGYGGGSGGRPGDDEDPGGSTHTETVTPPLPGPADEEDTEDPDNSTEPTDTTPPPLPPRIDWQAYLDEYDYGTPPEWDGSEYERRRDEALARAENMRWDYDPDNDPVWQAYQKQYRREGQRATQDALGRYAAMTGGVPSSYAMTAASQAGDYYAAQLSDRLPELYDNAYARYLREYERQIGLADAYEDYGKTEYDRYRDRLAQWNADRAFRYGLNRDALADARYDDELAYQRAWDEEERDYSRDYQKRRDAILDNRADRAWAQELRAYADAQGWKSAEWEQYLREYEDQLSEKERQWAYTMAQDAEDGRRWETQYQQSLREYDDAQREPDGGGKTESAASGEDAAESSGMEYSGTHPDGRKRTAGYGELKTMLRNALIGGSRDREQMRRLISEWAARGRIRDYEAVILLRELRL